MTAELLRIEPCESRGNYVLDIRIGDKWEPLHVGYMSVLEKMQSLIAAAIRAARDEEREACAKVLEELRSNIPQHTEAMLSKRLALREAITAIRGQVGG